MIRSKPASRAHRRTGTSRTRPALIPTRRTDQACTSVGTTCVGDRKRSTVDGTRVSPTVMSSMDQPPSLMPLSVTYKKPIKIFLPAYAERG
jgi:hypothetical protein